MRAKLKDLHSPDVDLRSYVPEQKDNFSIFIEALIGPEGSNTSDLFGITVCTPGWLADNCKEPMWARHMLIVPRYKYDEIRGVIERYCNSCEGMDWESLAKVLSRIAHWEFEDYRNVD